MSSFNIFFSRSIVCFLFLFIYTFVECITFPQSLCGKYNNFHQIQENQQLQRYSMKDGGHEAVEAEIQRSTQDTSFYVASYRTPNTTIPFRFRAYVFSPLLLPSINHKKHKNHQNRWKSPLLLLQQLKQSLFPAYHMRLLKPTKETEQKLGTYQYDLSLYFPQLQDFESLPSNTDIIWKKRFSWKRKQWYYLGKLFKEPCILPSSRNPNQFIRVKDELCFWLQKEELWVNDRVYTLDNQLIIGNSLNIPYKFQKTNV